jgi:hypothetical protein
MEIDLLLNETWLTSGLSKHVDDEETHMPMTFDVYLNPTEEEYIRHIPIEGRAFIDKFGNLYCEGWAFKKERAKEKMSQMIHSDLIEAIKERAKLPIDHSNSSNLYFNLAYGLPCYMVGQDFGVMLTYMIPETVMMVQRKFITGYMEKAKKKNPSYDFRPKKMM